MGLCLSLHPQPQPPQRSGGGDAVSALDDDNDCSPPPPPPPASSSAVSFSSPTSLKLRLRLRLSCCWRNISSCRNNILNNKAKKKNKKTKRAKKKKLGRANIEAAEEEEQVDQLHRIPGRMFVNGASEVACLFTQQGRKGTNQDAMLVWENFSSKKDTIFCGIFDGHGPYGHVIAKRVRDSLPLKLCAQWKDTSSGDQNSGLVGSMDSDEATSMIMDDDLCHSDAYNNKNIPEMYLPLKKSLLKAFKLMDKELKLHPSIDCFCSGSTAVALVKQGHDLVIGNVGDSRAVLGTRDKDNSMVALQLTVDLKPNLPKEAARIQQFKGRVFALQDEPEVARVWLPNSDSPGLAMARAFGDFCLKDFGLISVPDVSYHCLTERDEFIVLATDGVWDVLSNDEVVDIVASAPSRTTAARAIVDCAVRAWKLKFPTSKSDDCAVVCLFLDHPCSTNQALETTSDQRIGDADPIISPVAVEHQMDNEPILSSDTSCHGTDGPVLQNVFSLGDSDEIVPVCESIEEKHPGRCQSTRSLAECISIAEDEEWSALEGVTRVNSLLNLPRFLPGDKRAASWIRWF